MAERTEKHGFAKQALQWMSEMLGENFDTNGQMENVYTQLKDGRKLCR